MPRGAFDAIGHPRPVPWRLWGSFLVKWHFQSRLLCCPYHSKPHVGSRGALQPHTASPDSDPLLLCGPRRGGVGWGGAGWGGVGGVNSHGGLFLPPCWGRGPGTDARLWGTGLGAGSRNHVKSYCCAFCRVRVGMEAREDLRMGMGGGGAAPNSAELGSLTPRLPVLLPHAEGLPQIPTAGLCTSSRAGPPRRPCARVSCRKDSECCSSSLVGAGLCPRRWQEAFTRTSVLAGGKQTDLRPRYRGLRG